MPRTAPQAPVGARLAMLSRLRQCGALVACLVLALGVVAACAGSASSPRLAARVVGNQLANSEGKPLRLLGANRSGAEHACIQRSGFLSGPTDRRVTPA